MAVAGHMAQLLRRFVYIREKSVVYMHGRVKKPNTKSERKKEGRDERKKYGNANK